MKIIKQKIKEKSKNLLATWTATYQTLEPQYSNDLVKEMAKTLQEEIDWEVMMDILKETGYTHIKMDWPVRMNEVQAHEIKEWCRSNLTDHFHGRSNDWLFKSEKDATMFILRWA